MVMVVMVMVVMVMVVMVMVVTVMVVMVMVVMVIVPCGNGICSLLKGISTAPLSFGFPPGGALK